MFAVIFEVEPAAGRQQDYLNIAAVLRPELKKSTALFQSSDSPASPSPEKSCHCRSGATKRRLRNGASTKNIIARNGRKICNIRRLSAARRISGARLRHVRAHAGATEVSGNKTIKRPAENSWQMHYA